MLPAGTFTQTVLSNTGGGTEAIQVSDAGLTGTVKYTLIGLGLWGRKKLAR